MRVLDIAEKDDIAGLFAADRYVMPDQIAGVSGDRLTLRVTRDELIKR